MVKSSLICHSVIFFITGDSFIEPALPLICNSKVGLFSTPLYVIVCYISDLSYDPAKGKERSRPHICQVNYLTVLMEN